MKKVLSLILGVMFMITACDKNSAEIFAGKEYKLADAKPDVEITLGFAANELRFFGKAAINHYFGNYTVDGDKLKLETAGLTMMAGPKELMEAEQNYLKALSMVESYKLNGKKLAIRTSDGKTLVFDEIGLVEEDK